MTAAAERILAAFDAVPEEGRPVIADALRQESSPFLSALGLALTWPPLVARLLIDQALLTAHWDGSEALLGRLGDTEPWATVRDALATAINADPPTLTIAPDQWKDAL